MLIAIKVGIIRPEGFSVLQQENDSWTDWRSVICHQFTATVHRDFRHVLTNLKIWTSFYTQTVNWYHKTSSRELKSTLMNQSSEGGTPSTTTTAFYREQILKELVFHRHSRFSAFILLLSSWPMFSLCSVYSCLMSSRAASDFRGFLEAWMFLVGRTARLCCTISEASLRRSWAEKQKQFKMSLIAHKYTAKLAELTLVPGDQRWHQSHHQYPPCW